MITTYTSKEERYKRMINKLAANTSITDFEPGSIARAFIEIFNEEMEDFYQILDFNTSQAFLSYASGRFVDLIGAMLNCYRYNGESDENYKYRIGKQVANIAGANETSIRLKCLAVDGVKNVYLREFSYGIGSFSIYVMSNDMNNINSVISAVQSVLDQDRAFGVRGVALAPDIEIISIELKAYIDPIISTTEANSIIYDCRATVKRYLDNIEMGKPFYSSQLISNVLNTNSSITNAEVLSMKVDNKLFYADTYKPDWNTKILAGNILIK